MPEEHKHLCDGGRNNVSDWNDWNIGRNSEGKNESLCGYGRNSD